MHVYNFVFYSLDFIYIFMFLYFQYDMKQKRTFLKRSYCDSLTESDLYIGNVVNVFGRELKLIDYLSEATRNVLLKKTERFVLTT